MRFRRAVAAAGAFALALVLTAPGATASPGGAGERERLRDARGRAEAARSELNSLLRDFTSASLSADAASRRWLDLRLYAEQARAAEREARLAFETRVRSVYIEGSGRAAEIVLGSTDFSELAARLPYATTILERGRLDVRLLAERRRTVEQVLAAADEAQRALMSAEDRLATVRALIERRLAEAQASVRAGETALATLEAERLAYAHTVDRVGGATRSIRRQRGEAMFQAAAPYLGPRPNCDLPRGLRSTGDTLAGEASWYGNEFRGRPTASGAIFHPERFTVAHRTLPFGLYLLIRYGDRCVVSFLNDRGPYVEGRILDLSYGSAQAIGLTGAKDVTATLLVRAD